MHALALRQDYFYGSSLFSGGTYEAAVKLQDRNRILFRYHDRDAYKVSERGYEMTLSKASIYYVT